MGVLNWARPALVAAVLAGSGAADASATASAQVDARAAYDLSQLAIGRRLGDHVLTDRNGAALALADLRGRPLVISLVFTSCSSICPVTTEHLRDSIVAARKTLGAESFAVLTFGFDARRDRPTRLAAFADAHQLDSIPDWYLASADEETTQTLLGELGFSWRAAAGGFDHVTQTSIVDAKGQVYRQIYGEAFPLPVLMEPLKDLVLGTRTRSAAPADLLDRIMFLCTAYNPLTGAYRFDYGIVFGIFFGGLSLLLTGTVILRLWLGNRRAASNWPRRAIR